jgi:hypothetical protein
VKTTVALICLWLVGVAAAQKAPATIKLSPAEIYMTNRSAKEIIAYVLIYASKTANGSLSDDYYFKPQGIVPAGTPNVNDALPPEATGFSAAKLLFVQFADGTTWGDPRFAAEMLALRQSERDFLNRVKTSL